MTPKNKNVEYKIMKDGIIPLPDKSVDLVWVCLVLCCIKNQSLLNRTVDEINRVLKSNGLLFLIENTTDLPNSNHISSRSVDEYKMMFSYLSLVHISKTILISANGFQ